MRHLSLTLRLATDTTAPSPPQRWISMRPFVGMPFGSTSRSVGIFRWLCVSRLPKCTFCSWIRPQWDPIMTAVLVVCSTVCIELLFAPKCSWVDLPYPLHARCLTLDCVHKCRLAPVLLRASLECTLFAWGQQYLGAIQAKQYLYVDFFMSIYLSVLRILLVGGSRANQVACYMTHCCSDKGAMEGT